MKLIKVKQLEIEYRVSDCLDLVINYLAKAA